MLVRTLQVKLDEEDTLKVSIFQNSLNNQDIYYAKYININLDIYKDLSPEEQSTSYGITYTERTNGPIVYYNNLDEFVNDLPPALVNGPRLKSKT